MKKDINRCNFAAAVADVLVNFLSHPDRNRWINAIARATLELEENPFLLWNETENRLQIFSRTSGELYICHNDACECTASIRGNPCYHLAAFFIVKRYFEIQNSSFLRSQAELRSRILAADD
jgi:hypothetical protein